MKRPKESKESREAREDARKRAELERRRAARGTASDLRNDLFSVYGSLGAKN